MTADPVKLTSLAVDLNGRRVGTLNRLPGDKQIFVFEEERVPRRRCHRLLSSNEILGSVGRLP
jgi:hypothetical protein